MRGKGETSSLAFLPLTPIFKPTGPNSPLILFFILTFYAAVKFCDCVSWYYLTDKVRVQTYMHLPKDTALSLQWTVLIIVPSLAGVPSNTFSCWGKTEPETKLGTAKANYENYDIGTWTWIWAGAWKKNKKQDLSQRKSERKHEEPWITPERNIIS